MTRKVRDNGAEACIHFQKAETIAFFHNSREAFIPETSNEELRQKNECDRTAEEARQMFEELSAKADDNFLKNTGRRTNMKAENKLWESALNLRGRHTMADVQRVNARIQEITGFIPIQTAIHRDEGHIDEKTGDFVLNVHAQTTWLTQDPLTGKSMAYLLFDKKDVYRKIQDIVAEELGMIRGKPAEITGAKHFKNMRDYKQMKRAEGKLNKEWEQKLAEKEKAWQEKQAAWEAKLAEREAKREEWERKFPEIMEARERRSKFMSDKIDWEQIRESGRYRLAFIQMGNDIAGWPNPQGNFLLEAQKDAIRSIFYIFGSVTQLAVFIARKTWENDEKIKNEVDIFKVRENLNRAVAIIANDCGQNPSELQDKIYRILKQIPEHKQHELFDYAIQHAPNDEIKNDIRALIEGRFSDIAKSEAAQRRIENRDLRQALREYAAEAKRIKDELKEMDEENRILVAAERALLREKGAGREEYAEQEADNKARLEELKTLRQQVKDLNNDILNAKKQSELDKEKIAEQAAQIKELNEKIAEITEANVKKQKQLEAEKEEARRTAPQMPPKGAFDIIDELEAEKQPEPVKTEPKSEPAKIEPKPKPEPEQKPLKRSDGSEQSEAKPEPKPEPKKDDFTNIYGYERPKPEPRRRRFDDYERKIDDRPKYYEPEPEPEPIFRDPWTEIQEGVEKWKKADSEVEKNIIKTEVLKNIEKYEKSGVPPHRQMSLDSYVRALNYDPADAIHRERERKLETERKRQQAEMAIKYEEVKTKSVKQQEDDARQTTIKKKKKDELEMGMS